MTVIDLDEAERQERARQPLRIVRVDLPVVDAATLAGEPVRPRRWHVDPLIPGGNVTLLNGDGGIGKSLLALQLAVATVAGTLWIGLPVTSGQCIFVTAEDPMDEVHRRLVSIAEDAGISLDRLEGLSLVSLAGRDAVMAAPEGRTSILRQTGVFEGLRTLARDSSPALIVIDTLADCFGGDENQRAQARQFVSMLRGLAIDFDCTILVTAHPSLSGLTNGSGSSGSTAWNNSVRSRLFFDRPKVRDGDEPDPDARVLRTMKTNYGPTGGEIAVRWSAGVFRPVVSEAPAPYVVAAAQARAERVFMSLLASYNAEKRYVSASPSVTYAPQVFARDGRAEGVTKLGFTDAMNRLFSDRRIIVEEFGRPSKRRSRIAIAGESEAE